MSGKKISIFLIALIVIVVGFLWYQKGKSKKNQNVQPATTALSVSNSQNNESNANDNASAAGTNSDQTDQNFEAQCVGSQWVKVADVEGEIATVQGVMQVVDPEDEATKAFKNYRNYLDNGKEKIGLVDPNVKSDNDDSNLDFFQTREVEVQGVLGQGAAKEMKVSQIRCAGRETDKDLISQRNKVLEYISANINSITPKKAPYQKWTVLSAGLVNENNIYIEYYDIAEDSEDYDSEDTMHQVLLEIGSSPDGKYEAKVLAYWETAEDEYVLKSGTDKFENSEVTISYSYDSESNSWSRD